MLKRMRGRLDALYEEPEQRCRAGVAATSLLALALGSLSSWEDLLIQRLRARRAA